MHVCALLSTKTCLHPRHTHGSCVTALHWIPVKCCMYVRVGTASAAMWTLRTEGRLFHSGLPHKGINSLELGMEAIAYIQNKFYQDFPPVSFNMDREEREREREERREERVCVCVCTVFMLIKRKKILILFIMYLNVVTDFLYQKIMQKLKLELFFNLHFLA